MQIHQLGFIGTKVCLVASETNTKEKCIEAYSKEHNCSIERVRQLIEENANFYSLVEAPNGLFFAYELYD